MLEKRIMYAIVPPDKSYFDEFSMVESLHTLAEGAWNKFCYPSLRREGYESDGFKAKKVTVIIES